MIHDPCNPVPASGIPKGLSWRHQRLSLHVVGPSKPAPVHARQAVTAIAPVYIGCDHHTNASAAGRMNAVHFPPAIEVPAAILMPTPMISVVALASAAPLIVDPGEDFPISMPEPSGATMFLVAVLIVVLARRFNILHEAKPVRRHPTAPVALQVGRRHRCRPIAPYCALQI
jgi:hypothetical protein